MPVVAVLLAAGAGSRFVASTHKLLAALPTDAAPHARVVDRSLAAMLAAGFEQAAVVTGAVELWPAQAAPPGQTTPSGLTVLHNPDWANGLATSLQVAINWAQNQNASAIVVGLGDQPFVGTQAWQDVAAAVSRPDSEQQPSGEHQNEHQIAVATYDGEPANPVGLKRSVWELLPKTGDEGARQLIRSRQELWVPVACQGTPSDIDTVEDLEKWT